MEIKLVVEDNNQKVLEFSQKILAEYINKEYNILTGEKLLDKIVKDIKREIINK